MGPECLTRNKTKHLEETEIHVVHDRDIWKRQSYKDPYE